MMHDLIWSLQPGLAEVVAHRVEAWERWRMENGIDIAAGPAADASRDGLPVRVSGPLAVIQVLGPILRSVGRYGHMFDLSGTDDTRLAFESVAADPSVEQVLLRIDSPGGSVAKLNELGDVMRRFEKPITAVIDGVGASAAYYIASHADRILMGERDLVGSIGTIMMVYDASKAFEKEGIKAIPVDTGEHKHAGALGTEVTATQLAQFQNIVDYFFNDFVDRVAVGRNLNRKDVLSLADGRVFTAQEALGAGLVDGFATYGDTLRSLRGDTRGRRTTSARARLQL